MRKLYLGNGNQQFKFDDTTTEIQLNAFDDFSAATLTANAKVRIKNEYGYLLMVSASITDNHAVITSGQLAQLPVGNYLLELWDAVNGGTAIYPSDGFLALHINGNVTGLSGGLVSSITVDDFIKQFSSLSNQLKQQVSDDVANGVQDAQQDAHQALQDAQSAKKTAESDSQMLTQQVADAKNAITQSQTDATTEITKLAEDGKKTIDGAASEASEAASRANGAATKADTAAENAAKQADAAKAGAQTISDQSAAIASNAAGIKANKAQLDTIQKNTTIADPATVVHLLDGPNLVANGRPMSTAGWNTSNASPWKLTIVPGQYWEIPVTQSAKGVYLQTFQRLMKFPNVLSQMRSGDRIDMSLEVMWTASDDVSGIAINIAAVQGGMGTATSPTWTVVKKNIPLDMPADTWKRIEFSGIVPDGIEANAAGASGLERFYFEVYQLNDTGSTATIRLCNFSARTDHQYTAKPVTSVGGQVPGEDGDIDMSGYVLKADFEALNNTVKDLKTQISGGGLNLEVITTETAGYWVDENGKMAPLKYAHVSDFIAIDPAKAYTFQYWSDATDGRMIGIGMSYYTEDKAFGWYKSFGQRANTYYGFSQQLGIPATAAYIRISYYTWDDFPTRIRFNAGADTYLPWDLNPTDLAATFYSKQGGTN